MSTHSEALERQVRSRLNSLTKPVGSLGDLEEIALRFALISGEAMPSSDRKGMYIFCGDHGVTAEGVSPFPSSVTYQMVCNFARGGAAINVLCRQFDIQPVIVDVGVNGPSADGVVNKRVMNGTRNFAQEPAMTRDEVQAALAVGREMAAQAAARFDMVGLGEMGIGNTTCAAALLSAFTGLHPAAAAGTGTGCDEAGMARKVRAIQRAIELHQPDPADPIGVLAAVGGLEITAITGFLLEASERQLPVVLDGFPCCAGALAARALSASALQTAFFGHISAERGHAFLLESLHAHPMLSLGMRLGEGSGAALAMSIIDSGVRLYRQMATFEEAGVHSS